MYIEFQLPQGMSTRVMANAIKADIAIWADRYQVPASVYSQKTIKYTHRLGFNHEKYFSLFIMTWNSFNFQVINIVNERY